MASSKGASDSFKTIVHNHYISLRSDELKKRIEPESLRSRVADGQYFWQTFIASGAPLPALGLDGDVWVDAGSHRQIHFRKDGRWWLWCPLPRNFNPTRSGSTSRARRASADTSALVSIHPFHPWLAKRALLLNPWRGTLAWEFCSNILGYRKAWDAYCGLVSASQCRHAPCYDTLTATWLSHFLLASARRERWVLRLLPHLNDARVPKKPLARGPLAIVSANVSSPSGNVQNEEERLAPNQTQPKRGRAASSASQDPQPSSKRVKQADPPPMVNQEGSDEAIEQEAVVGDIQHSDSEVAIKEEEDDSTGSIALRSSLGPPQLHENIEAFLCDIPVPLMHLVPTFAQLGIATFTHLQSLACLSPDLLQESLTDLKERGLKPADIGVLRTAFKYVRCHPSTTPAIQARAQGRISLSSSDTIDKFLSDLRPSLAHHLTTCVGLGMRVEHLPDLIALSAPMYATLHDTLRGKGFTWAELYMLKGALRRVVVLQETHS